MDDILKRIEGLLREDSGVINTGRVYNMLHYNLNVGTIEYFISYLFKASDVIISTTKEGTVMIKLSFLFKRPKCVYLTADGVKGVKGNIKGEDVLRALDAIIKVYILRR